MHNDKFELSKLAMKHVSYALGKGDSAEAALMRGLREDNPTPIHMKSVSLYSDAFRDYKIAKGPLFLMNVIGSFDMLSRLLRQASRRGYRTLYLGQYLYSSWADCDVEHHDISDEISFDPLTLRRHAHLFHPELCRTSKEDVRATILRLHDALKGVDLSDCVIGLHYLPVDEVTAPLIADLMKRAHTAIFSFEDVRHAEPVVKMFPKYDLMASSLGCWDVAQELIAIRPDLSERILAYACQNDFDWLMRAIHFSPDGAHRFLSIYPEPFQPGDKIFAQMPAIPRAIKSLATFLEEQESETHMQRLKLIARACGYRNWHAAEVAGRKI